MNLERPYFEDINYHPLIFYIVFGVGDDELVLSKEKHKIDEVPEGLNIQVINRSNDSNYMDNLTNGILGKVLREDNKEVFDKIKSQDKWAIINGEIKKDNDLKYIQNAVGIIEAFIDMGAIAVLDMQTFTLLSSEEFKEKIFSKEFNPFSHVRILLSKMDDGNIWLHTRGMRKFGRPDISIEGVSEKEVNKAIELANQMIIYGTLGMFFNKKTKINISKEEALVIDPKYIKDFDNDDFNNSYYKVLWEECGLIK